MAKTVKPDPPVSLIEDGKVVRLMVAGQDIGLDLTPIRRDTLTLAEARDLPSGRDSIVRFRRASPDAKRTLQERKISYASDDGEVFVLDPPIAIHQSSTRGLPAPGGRRDDGPKDRAPFATKASRVSRWLLLHRGESFNVRQLARHTQLSEGAVSTTVRELHERMLVEIATDRDDARSRWVRVDNPMPLLDAWTRAWELQRVRTLDWDIGSTSVEGTLDHLREVSSTDPSLRWAIGGTAGAAKLVRAVEPAEVLLWIERDDVEDWDDLLVPAPGRGRRGTLRLAFAPDPYIFELTKTHDRLQIADPAQIYLDVAREGERALEAADALRRQMRW